MKNKEKYLSTSDLAKILGISRVAVFNKIDEGKINAVKIGRNYVIEKDKLPQEIKDVVAQKQKETVAEVIKLGQKSGKDLDFEKELWKAADKLRGNIDASDYKHIVLGLIFLKYVSDSFYQRRQKLEQWTSDPKNKKYYIPEKESRKIIVDNKDQYVSRGIFYIPEKARWDYLQKYVHHSDIGKYIDEAMVEIENENQKWLKGILPKKYTGTSLESQILGELINIFSKINFNHDIDKEKDILGRVYEYFLGQFASAEGKRGGEFFTPPSIVKLLVEVLEPFENARIFDPACGSGGMFVQSREFLKIHQQDPSKIAFFGQESNPTTLQLCKMNLAIRGIFGQIELGSSYYEDKFPNLRADFCIANPPFNAEWEPEKLNERDPRIHYGIPPKGNANFLWVQHFIYHLAPNGMAGFVMANGSLASNTGGEGEIRKKIIEDDLVDIIIACPPKLFYNVAIPVSLWFVSKNKENGRFRNRKGEILFIDAKETFEPISKKQVIFTKEQIQKIANTVRAWREKDSKEKYEDIAGFCKAAKKDEIIKNGYVLTPGRYVGIKEEEDDGIPFEDKMADLTKKLSEQMKEEKRLDEEIKKQLSNVGFELK